MLMKELMYDFLESLPSIIKNDKDSFDVFNLIIIGGNCCNFRDVSDYLDKLYPTCLDELIIKKIGNDEILSAIFEILEKYDLLYEIHTVTWHKVIVTSKTLIPFAKKCEAGYMAIAVENPELFDKKAFDEKFPLKGFDLVGASNWVYILLKCPQFAKYCEDIDEVIDTVTSIINDTYYARDLIKEILNDNGVKTFSDFVIRCPDLLIYGESTIDILNEFGINRIHFSKEEGTLFSILKTKFIEEDCDLSKLKDPKNSSGWMLLLSLLPNAINECPITILNEFESGDWLVILRHNPNLIDEAKKYPSGWCAIVQKNPDLASECDCWNAMRDFEIEILQDFFPNLKKYLPNK